MEVGGLAHGHREDQLLLDEGPVGALARDEQVAAGPQAGALGLVHLLPAAEDGAAREDGDGLVGGVGVGGDGHAFGELHEQDGARTCCTRSAPS